MFGVAGGAPQVITALRAVWLADLRIVASQSQSPPRALIIAQAVSLVRMILPRQRVQINNKETFL